MTTEKGQKFQKAFKGDKHFNPYEKCTVSSMLFDLDIRFLPIEKSMFSGLTKLPKNFCSDKDELECDSENLYPTKHLLRKLMEYKELKRKSDGKEKTMPLKVFLNNGYNMRDVTLLSTYEVPQTTNTQTQTDYRETDAQTDPYSPDYFIPSNSDPANNEILSISLLKYGCGLPAGVSEVELIARLQDKKEWDAKQKKLEEKCQIEMRMKNVEDAYARDWSVREEEIERILNLRLKLTMRMLKVREEQSDEKVNKRLKILWKNKIMEIEEKLKMIKKENLRAIRKIIRSKCKEMQDQRVRDVVADYTDQGSQVFAPLTRLGVFHDKAAPKLNVKSCYLGTYEGLLKLEKILFENGKNSFNAGKCKPKKTFETMKKKRKEAELEKIHEKMKKERLNEEKGPMQLKFLQKIEKPAMRSPTPSLKFQPQESINRELAIMILQRALRGRLDQVLMLNGKKMSIELIKELRSTHALLKTEQDVIAAMRDNTLLTQQAKKSFEDKEMKMDSLLKGLEGEALSDAADFLTKELVRLKEEKKVDAFVMLAERNRRMREAEESGERQIEERRRRGADEVFKQIVKVHQDTVDDYLQDIIVETVHSSAKEEAKIQVEKIAMQVNSIAHDTELSRSTVDTEEIVARLVLNFLIPEVNKKTHNNKRKAEERGFLETAHKSLYD